MNKKMYKEPKIDVAVMPGDALLVFNPSPDLNPAPKRVVTPTNPVAPADTVQVF